MHVQIDRYVLNAEANESKSEGFGEDIANGVIEAGLMKSTFCIYELKSESSLQGSG